LGDFIKGGVNLSGGKQINDQVQEINKPGTGGRGWEGQLVGEKGIPKIIVSIYITVVQQLLDKAVGNFIHNGVRDPSWYMDWSRSQSGR
jgi:hypothetical protein